MLLYLNNCFILSTSNSAYIYTNNSLIFYCLVLKKNWQHKTYITNFSLQILLNNKNKKEIKNLSYFLSYSSFFQFKKILCSGKIFRVKKYSHFLKFLVNTSHNVEYLFTTNLLKMSKNKFFVKWNFKNYLLNNQLKLLLNFRFVNRYTKRGLRFSALKLYKRKGKSNVQI